MRDALPPLPAERERISQTLILAVGVAALAGLLFGFDTAVVAGVTQSLRERFHLSPAALGFTISSALWGTVAGAAPAGPIGRAIGYRTGLQVTGALYLASAVGCAASWDQGSLVSFRVLCGLAIGGSSVLAPVYLAEISPAKRRGALVGMFQVAIVVGILLAYLSNFAVQASAPVATAWRWKLGAAALPALVFLTLLTRAPESPRWLRLRGRKEQARRSARALGIAEPSREAAAIPEILATAPVPGFWRAHKRAIALTVTLAAFNQLTGINAVLYYANDIFASSGHGTLSPEMQAVVIGAVNLAFTLAAMTVIDRLGRRPLLLIGSMGMCASLTVAALVMAGRAPHAWLLGVLVVFIASFAFSQGAVIWVYASELFPTPVRSLGQGLASGVIWVADAIVTQTFPVVAAKSPSAPFVVFATLMGLQGVVVLLAFPETKGLSLEGVGEKEPAR